MNEDTNKVIEETEEKCCCFEIMGDNSDCPIHGEQAMNATTPIKQTTPGPFIVSRNVIKGGPDRRELNTITTLVSTCP